MTHRAHDASRTRTGSPPRAPAPVEGVVGELALQLAELADTADADLWLTWSSVNDPTRLCTPEAV
jgi:hypothetical protein